MKSLTRLRTAIATAAAIFSGTLALAKNPDGASVPLDMSGERPTAQMTIGDVTRTVIVDTGAGATVVFPDFADAAGLPRLQPLRASAPGQPGVEGFLSQLTNARLGEALVATAPAAIVDLNLPLEGISGVASPNMFSGKLVRMDFGESEMRVLPRDEAHIPQVEKFDYYSTSFGRRIPAIPVTVGDEEYEAILDTGNGRGLVFPLSEAENFTLNGEMVPTKPLRMAGDNQLPAFLATIQGTIHIGPLTFENPELTFVDGVEEVNVGMAFLRQLVITLDPEEGELWIEAADPAEPG
ncbi:MAG TPA: pepsin/retropepsin-like aspartic protease family protein [Micropepsaceae bacterium]|nr:pepsin/retropepsin-like aspartic protease family protein [Micropepsaceae bacterium]